ncbi:MAG: hypothetical protein LAN70_02475 [Acidobacteriia bacterium]|nr:hypothetical protein [Terriglobia bacterium]
MTLEECRQFYADEVRFAANLSTPGLADAFARVRREQFLGPGPWQIASADVRGMSAATGIQMSYTPIDDPRHLYHNVVVVLDKDRDINNGQPSALGRWIDALQLQPGDRAYHLGCGVGYYTAIMAEVVGAGGSVVGCEVRPDLALWQAKPVVGAWQAHRPLQAEPSPESERREPAMREQHRLPVRSATVVSHRRTSP